MQFKRWRQHKPRRSETPPRPRRAERIRWTRRNPPAIRSKTWPASPTPKIAWDGALPEPFRLREEAVLRADLLQLANSLKALDKQKAQKLATKKRLDMSIAYQQKLMDTLNQRVSTRQQAIDLNVGTKINLYDAKQELEKSQSDLASDEGQLIETAAAIKELESEKTKTVSQFIADNQNKLADASRKADEAREALAKASARLARTRLVSPIDGVVQQTAVTTVGQVVTTGQQLAVITPAGGKLQVEALVANLDIGFVNSGRRRWSRSTPSRSPNSACCTARSSRSRPARSTNRTPSGPSPTRPLRPTSRRPKRSARSAGELRLPRHRRARRDRDEDQQLEHSADPRHDGHDRDQDELTAGDRLPSVSPRQKSPRRPGASVSRRRNRFQTAPVGTEASAFPNGRGGGDQCICNLLQPV